MCIVCMCALVVGRGEGVQCVLCVCVFLWLGGSCVQCVLCVCAQRRLRVNASSVNGDIATK